MNPFVGDLARRISERPEIPTVPRISRKIRGMDGSGMYSVDSGTHHRIVVMEQAAQGAPTRSESHPGSSDALSHG